MSSSHHDAQDRIQGVILHLVDTHGGGDQATIRDELDRQLRDVGIGEQPAKWLSDTATEISHGRTVVTSTHSKVDVDMDTGEVTTQDVAAGGGG